MKQFTTPEQTVKLIELGFERLKGWCNEDISSLLKMAKHKLDDEGFNYSIGELIEILDNISNNMWNFTRTSTRVIKVEINVFPETKKDKHLYKVSYNKELIDALHEMVVKLKEEGMV